MKRRKFIVLSTAGAIASTLPFCHAPKTPTSLSQPLFLSALCDIKTLAQIGKDYRSKNPDEKNESTLTQLLSTTTISDAHIQQDFATGETAIIDGWILSITEARQCALLSTQKP